MNADKALMLSLAHENERLRSELCKLQLWAADSLPTVDFNIGNGDYICVFVFSSNTTRFELKSTRMVTDVEGVIWDGCSFYYTDYRAHDCTEIEFDGSRITFRQDAKELFVFDIRPDGYSLSSMWGDYETYEHPLFHTLEFEKKLRAFCAIPGNPTKYRDVGNTQ